jgi:pilus assembly protein CpaB
VRRRILVLVAALITAALGTALVFMYANRAQDSARGGQEQVEVLVATASIPVGTTGMAVTEAGSVELRTLPASSVPPGALSDLTPVVDEVTITSVFPGQVLLAPMFGTEQQAERGLSLPQGTMAVAVQLGDPERVAGFVRPGSDVAVFVTTAATGAEPRTSTSLLLERVPVLAVGTSTATGAAATSPEQIPTTILTLALTQQQAQKVILATSTAAMHFALLDPQSSVDDRVAGTTVDDLLD